MAVKMNVIVKKKLYHREKNWQRFLRMCVGKDIQIIGGNSGCNY